MIIIIHSKAKVAVKAYSSKGDEVNLQSSSCTEALWTLAEQFPEEIIAWCEEGLQESISIQNWKRIFSHDLIMASYAVYSTYLPDSIGYVDQLPYVNVNREVQYGTWKMSCDIGGIKGKVLSKFRGHLAHITNFGFLLNSVSKIGQQNCLFCYSAPDLTSKRGTKPVALASSKELFRFTFQHYKSIWCWILFFCLTRYEKKILVSAAIPTGKKLFIGDLNLSEFIPPVVDSPAPQTSIDVIIPTLGRPGYVAQVLEDLKNQTLLPKRVILVEQNPVKNSQSELAPLISREWPFLISHHFINEIGACNARNIALEDITGDWIFFADDDIRFRSSLLEESMKEINRFRCCALNLNCKQKGESTVFHKIKQWGSFGSGTSIVKSSIAKNFRFSPLFEFGYGEDVDFGMQLRNEGCDIIYHPTIEILHLKASSGGFRFKPTFPWEMEELIPKPSPTMMVLAKKYYTPQQFHGFKISLFLKFYKNQGIRNPISYIRHMNLRWIRSEEWADILLQSSGPYPYGKNAEESSHKTC